VADDLRTDYDAIEVAVERLTEAVRTSRSDVADAAAVLVNVGDVRCLLRALQHVHEVCDQVEANPVGWGGPTAVSLARTLRGVRDE
jgi:hypothetical protein